MIFCVVSESLGTAALSHYLEQQDYVQAHHAGGSEYNNDFIGIASYNIFCGIFVAFIFGGAFFFDLMFPERVEVRGVRIAWRCCSVAAVIFTLADMIALTTIVAGHSAYVTNVSSTSEINSLITHISHTPLEYNRNPRCVASVVFLWLGFPCVVASTVIMFASLRHNEAFGPLTTHARKEREAGNYGAEAAGGRFEMLHDR